MRTFTCAQCGGFFQANNVPEDVTKERDRVYAEEPLEDGDEFVSVCDTCWRDTLKRIAAQPERKAAPIAFQILRENKVK